MDVREELFKNQDVVYADFHSRLVPNVDRGRIIGVRVPVLRRIAKRAARENAEILDYYYEEKMVRGFVIGYKNMPLCDRLDELERFVADIDNWAVCDGACATYKFALENPREAWDFILRYKTADGYRLRFMLVMMLNFYLTDEYIDRVLEIAASVKSEEYYVNMAAAWLLSTAYVKYPEKTLCLIKNRRLTAWVHNKTIQKICESYRVDKKDKEYLKTLKVRA